MRKIAVIFLPIFLMSGGFLWIFAPKSKIETLDKPPVSYQMFADNVDLELNSAIFIPKKNIDVLPSTQHSDYGRSFATVTEEIGGPRFIPNFSGSMHIILLKD